jgi:hypothetical protein
MDEKERLRQQRIRLGRESFERKRRTRESSVTTDLDGDIDMDRDRFSPTETPPSSFEGAGGAKRRRGKTADDEEDEDPPIEPEDSAPRRSARKFTKEAIMRENEEERRQAKERKKRDKEREEMRSRFIEGSMRDRHSLPPPREIIGDLESGSESESDDGDDDDKEMDKPATPPKEKDKEKKKKRFTFGLGSFFRFNPLAIVEEARAAYLRQKALHEARERKKEELKRQKKEAEKLYFEMKARGQFKGTFVTHVDDDDYVATPVGTDKGFRADFSQAAAALMGSTRKRKLGEVASVGSDKDAQEDLEIPTGQSDGECEGEEPDDDAAIDEDNQAYEPSGDMDEFKGGRYEDASQIELTSTKKTSRISSGASKSSSTSLVSSNGAAAKPAKPPTKRELQKQERLKKKVEDLEERLDRVRRELAETSQGSIIVSPVPEIPRKSMPPLSSARTSLDRRNDGMLPPPVPRSVRGASVPSEEKQRVPETPALKYSYPNQMLPDTPESSPDDDRNVPRDPEVLDDDTTMDEGFSMIPLSPVLHPSSIVNTSTTNAEQQSAASRANVRRNAGRSKSPALSGLQKISGSSIRKVSRALANAVGSGSETSEKPERKKRRGMDEEALPAPKLSSSGIED